MAEVDFMIACDYVRAQNGIFHMIGGGFDRIIAPGVPTVHSLGVAIRLNLAKHECDVRHDMEIVFEDGDGQAQAKITGQFRSSYPQNVPEGWPAFAALGINFAVPIPRYGTYMLRLSIDGEPLKTISLFVNAPDGPAGATGGPTN